MCQCPVECVLPLTQFSTPLAALDVVVIDTETTGLDARSARIVQLAGIPVTGEAIARERGFETLINPGIAIPLATTKIHGIRDGDVANAPRFSEFAAKLEAHLGKAIIVGHTISYDLAILRREYQLADRVWHQPRALDVRHLAQLARPSLAGYDLDRLCQWLGIDVNSRHTAMGDAEATARIYVSLIPMLRAQNIRTLAEAEAASRRLADTEAQVSGGLSLPESVMPVTSMAALASLDSFAYRHRVREIMSAPVVYADRDLTLEAMIQAQLGQRISSVLVELDPGTTGIVTEKDILRIISQHGAAGLQMRMKEVASAPVQMVEESDFVYRAIGRMGRLGFRHLVVRNASGAITGIVTAHRLLRQRAKAAIVLGDEIDQADSAAALGRAWAKLPSVTASLIADDVDALTVTSVISTEIAGMTRRAAELAEVRMIGEGHGAPPVAYAVMVLGSGGRGESQLAADQDNAIVYASGVTGGPEGGYFERLATYMNEMLDTAGIPFCKGGVMAKNAHWCRSVDAWRITIDGWVRHKRPEDLLNVDIYFDAICVHGDAALVATIWDYAFERTKGEHLFQWLLAAMARKRHPAVSLFGGLRVDAQGRQDLKATGLLPIFSCGRVLAIKHGIRAHATPERLSGLVGAGVAAADVVQTIVDAQKVILATILGQQLIDIEAGIPPTPKVVIARLDKVEKARLKQALGNVDEAIRLVAEVWD